MISEIDIKDWHHLPVEKLYNVKPKSYIKADDTVLFFSHIDGMYSFCKDLQDNVVHLAAWTEVTPLQKPE